MTTAPCSATNGCTLPSSMNMYRSKCTFCLKGKRREAGSVILECKIFWQTPLDIRDLIPSECGGTTGYT